jgi:hypothetical protein
MISENIKANGLVSFLLVDQFGNIKQKEEHNLVVTTGLSYLISRAKDATATAMSHIAVGTGTTVAATTQSVLVGEVARVALTSTTQVTTTVTGDAIQYVATFPAGSGTSALTEAGIFNAASGGTMMARTVFAVINKGALDTLTITWKITIA